MEPIYAGLLRGLVERTFPVGGGVEEGHASGKICELD
jgi:hypothetical protein